MSNVLKIPGLTGAEPIEIEKNVTKCNFCNDVVTIPAWSKNIVEHLIVTVDVDSKVHVHGPLNNPELISRMISAIEKEVEKRKA